MKCYNDEWSQFDIDFKKLDAFAEIEILEYKFKSLSHNNNEVWMKRVIQIL
jgi:hypothetical protein